MSTSPVNPFFAALRRSRNALLRMRGKRLPGRFQPYNHTLPNRYPWIFEFLRSTLADSPRLRLLSFGCSRGVEVFSLRDYFPGAALKGIDIDPANIAACRDGADSGMTFEVAANVSGEQTDSYDAIVCLAVLCHGDLSVPGIQRCDPLLRFNDFEALVGDFARCLRPGGLLILHTTSFRFCDTRSAAHFDTVLEAQPEQLAADVKFDRANRLLPGVTYREVGFRKRTA